MQCRRHMATDAPIDQTTPHTRTHARTHAHARSLARNHRAQRTGVGGVGQVADVRLARASKGATPAKVGSVGAGPVEIHPVRVAKAAVVAEAPAYGVDGKSTARSKRRVNTQKNGAGNQTLRSNSYHHRQQQHVWVCGVSAPVPEFKMYKEKRIAREQKKKKHNTTNTTK